MQRERPERFLGLDLLRGVAAFSVLVMHLPWPMASNSALPRAYLAVDLFFVLSGFVIAHAYQHRLGSPAQFRQFCIARIIRLYPLYLLATLVAAAGMLVVASFGTGRHPDLNLPNIFSSLPFALLFLPTPSSFSVMPVLMFPLLFTAWSLFWEILVNLLYGSIAGRLRPKSLAALIAVGLFALAAAIAYFGTANAGIEWSTSPGGGARALFSFFAGVAVFRIRQRFRPPAISAALLSLVLVLTFVPAAFGGPVFDLACIALLFPLLVWLGAESAIAPPFRPLASMAGYLSYPIYLLQAPLLFALGPISTRVDMPVTTLKTVEFAGCLVLVPALSWLVAHYFDSPVRKELRLRYARPAPRTAAQSAP